MRKAFLVLVAIALLASPAFAGNRPEYDTVACDYTNFFSYDFDLTRIFTARTNLDGFGNPINLFSDFSYRAGQTNNQHDPCFLPEFYGECVFDEFFENTAGQCYPDPCFGFCFDRITEPSGLVENSNGSHGYQSALTDAWNQGEYVWQIVLQMKPESDINLNIQDCVLKHNGIRPWNPFFFQNSEGVLEGGDEAEQTGRYRASWGQLFFVAVANPTITAEAIPGPYATPGFVAPVFLDARNMPGLGLVPLVDALYTSKAVWEDDLVIALPETGTVNQSGQTMYNLKQGDKIKVSVAIPPNNSVDIRYGPDNIILEYIGIVGTEYVSSYPCWAPAVSD
jgi:hypothetical protein